MFFIKNIIRDQIADLKSLGVVLMSETFGIRALKSYQTKAMVQFLQKKIDVFVNLLTGSARSPIYQALPFVFYSIFAATGHVIVVVSLLVNHIKDQVVKLANLGILVASRSDISEENARVVRARKCLK